MRSTLNLVEHNLHEVQVGDKRMLFHVPTTSLFGVDPLTGAVIDTLRAHPEVPADGLGQLLTGRFDAAAIQDTVRDLLSLDIITDGSGIRPDVPVTRVEDTALNTVVMTVNTGCNLSCTYCYKEDLDAPVDGKKMETSIGEAAFEMLVRDSPDEKRYTVVFFGGEPLTNLPFIRYMVQYCERRCKELGKRVDFVMTTNATLLTEPIVDWMDAHRFGISISMDGPEAIHDKNRVTVGGEGTYKVVRRKAEMLLKRYRSRPVGARVTLTRGITDIEGIWDHLFNELGFAEVGFAPVTSGDLSAYNLSQEDLAEVFQNMKVLGERYLDAALQNRTIGFSNMHQIITDIHEGHKKSLPCGAGLKMLAVDRRGNLNLCHRFTGSSVATFGNVNTAVDKIKLTDFLSQRLDRSGTYCETCYIRNLCSGGCYHEGYARYGETSHPTYHYCNHLRDWFDFNIRVYSRIMEENPAFIDTFVTPRKVH